MDKKVIMPDANAVIDHLNKKLDLNAFFAAHSDCGKSISVIAFMEALAKPGMSDDDVREARDFLAGFALVDMTPEIRETAISMRRTAGLKLPDAIIAATALSLGADIISRDNHLL
jgi:predicted nucleic acid-binding protein